MLCVQCVFVSYWVWRLQPAAVASRQSKKADPEASAASNVILYSALPSKLTKHKMCEQFRTEANVLNVSDKEFWFSAYIKHTDIEILSEQQRIDDLVQRFATRRLSDP
jgi:hypothetical protein